MKLRLLSGVLTTTVGELIKKLQEFDPDVLVFTEGCDCIGNVIDVITLDKRDGSVLLKRDDDEFDYDENLNPVVKDKYKDKLLDK